MTIETKYNIGQEVWHRGYHNCISKSVVTSITIQIEEAQTNIFYSVNNKLAKAYSENMCFPTKEELLKSL